MPDDGALPVVESTLPEPSNNQPLEQVLMALDELSINEPKRSWLAQSAHITWPGYLAAWATWYPAQSEFGTGWLILQLEAGKWPPGWSSTGEPPPPPPVLEIPLPPPPVELSPEEPQWQQILGQLQMQMTQATFDTWIKGTRVLGRDDDRRLLIGVKSAFAKDWLENRLYTTIIRTARGVFADPQLGIRFVLEDGGASLAVENLALNEAGII